MFNIALRRPVWEWESFELPTPSNLQLDLRWTSRLATLPTHILNNTTFLRLPPPKALRGALVEEGAVGDAIVGSRLLQWVPTAGPIASETWPPTLNCLTIYNLNWQERLLASQSQTEACKMKQKPHQGSFEAMHQQQVKYKMLGRHSKVHDENLKWSHNCCVQLVSFIWRTNIWFSFIDHHALNQTRKM